MYTAHQAMHPANLVFLACPRLSHKVILGVDSQLYERVASKRETLTRKGFMLMPNTVGIDKRQNLVVV